MALYSCADNDPNRHLELAKWYNSKGLYDEAISEYREVIRLYPESTQNLSREEYQLSALCQKCQDKTFREEN